MDKVLVIVGIGGVGSRLAVDICQWNAYAGIFSNVYLIDGDNFESKNLERQSVESSEVGDNKAKTVADRIIRSGYKTDKYQITVIPEYINSAKLDEFISERDSAQIFLVAAVDNDKTKAELNNWFNTVPNIVGFMAGNEYSDGTVAAAVRENGKATTPDFSYMQGEGEDNNILNPKDKSPDEMSCDEEAPSFPQLILANIGGSFFTFASIYSYVCGNRDVPYRMVYFDVDKLGAGFSEFPVDALERVRG